MNFYAILGMAEMPKIESTTRKIAQNAKFYFLRFLTSLPDVAEFHAEPTSTIRYGAKVSDGCSFRDWGQTIKTPVWLPT